MRIGFQSVYSNFMFNQQNTQEMLQSITKQLSSGKKIQFGYEGSSTFVDSLRLEYEQTTLKQTKDVAERAKKFSDNTDTSLNQLAESLEEFKFKLVQAANEIHSDISMSAIADDLEAIKKHIISISNTSVGGQYIFSGSRVNVKPVADDGTYYGDSKKLQALIGSNNLMTYNVNGDELFHGKDSDISRYVTSNVKHFNRELQHPQIMTENLKDSAPVEKFIEETDTLRSLIGDYDDDTTTSRSPGVRGDTFGGAANEAALLTSFQAVAAGKMRVSVDGNNVDLTAMDFTGASSLADVASTIQTNYESVKSGTDPYVTVSWNERTKTFDFTSSRPGGTISLDIEPTGLPGTEIVQTGYLGAASTHSKLNSEYFYMTGRKPDGTTFKSKFDLGVNYTDEGSATKIRDLLDRIGVELGNSALNKVVDVRLNEWGQIEIKDFQSGRSFVDFHIVSSNMSVQNIDDLAKNGAKVTEYMKHNYYSLKTLDRVTSSVDDFDHRIHRIDSTLKRDDNSLARTTDSLSSILSGDLQSIVLSGSKVNGGGAVNTTVSTAGMNVQDLLDRIKREYSASGPPYDDVGVSLNDGKIIVIDNTVGYTVSGTNDEIYDSASTLSVQMSAFSDIAATAGNEIDAFANDYSASFDKVRLEKSGAKLYANNSQVKTVDSNYATLETKLSEVASTQVYDPTTGLYTPDISLSGSVYKMDITDINGVKFKMNISFNDSASTPPGTTYTVSDASGNTYPTGVPAYFNLYNRFDDSSATYANNVTYKQLTDVVSIGMNFSNLISSGIMPDSTSTYKNALDASFSKVEVALDKQGRLYVHDKTTAYTKAQLAIYDSSSSDFSNLSGKNGRSPQLVFHASNALVVDDPHVNFYDQLQEAIDAVKYKIYRPDGYNSEDDYDSDTRNIGIQNAIESIDHLLKHVNKLHAKNGSQGNSFQYAVERNEILIVQVKTLKSNVLDSDIAEVSMNFSQLSLNYQAMLATISKINNLSLLNYI